MTFIRRAALISAGVTAGVASAPYLCSTPTPASFSVPVTPARTPTPMHARDSAVNCVARWLDAAAGGVTDVRRAIIGDAHRAAVAAAAESEGALTSSSSRNESDRSSVGASEGTAEPATVNEAPVDTTPFREVPHKLKDRFLHYARRDPESGEFVLTLDNFVRCMLLPESESEASRSAHLFDLSYDGPVGQPQELSSSASPPPPSWLQKLPPTVRRRFVHFFHCVDLDGTNSIDYAEFVVLFTFLSTRRQTLERAFRVFDLDDNGRLSEHEFCRLLNTIMVDPAVQVTYTSAGSRNSSEADTTTASTASRAGESRRSERRRQQHKNELSFELSSDVMRPLLFGPLPLHIGAPPGSMHYTEFSNRSPTDVVMTASRNAQASTTDGSGVPSTGWWSGVGRVVQHAWSLLRQRGVAELRSGAAAPPSPSSSSSAAAFHVNPPSRMIELQQMAAQDTLLETVSYPTFLYRMDYLRWELRAIEFGLCDRANNGFITVEDCRMLLRRDRRAIADGTAAAAAAKPGTVPVTSATNTAHGAAVTLSTDADAAASTTTARDALRSAPVTWQVYQKLFDVIKESNTILPALQLMLDSLPPVPEEVLRGGAIPDAELQPATLAVKEVVQQTVLSYNRKMEKERADAAPDGASEVNAQDDEEAQETKTHASASTDASTAQARFNAEKFGISAALTQSPEETRRRAQRLQAALVRPTALTWRQFSHAIAAVGAVPRLTPTEEALFRALLDEDDSDSLAPHEFARLCTMKESFFAEHLPRFDEPKRNVVQQFFFCMQQLD